MNFTAESGIAGLTNDTPLLFYKKSYATIQKYEKLHIFKASMRNRPALVILFAERDGVANSLLNSPFGSFLAMERVATDLIKEFLAFIADHLRRRKMHTLEIVQPSSIYGPFPDEEAFKFFHVKHRDFNQHLDLELDFEDQLHSMQKRKLKAAAKGTITCHQEGEDALIDVHDLIAKSREQNGLEVNISLQRLGQLFQSIPDTYRVFSAFQNDVRIATAITCQVTPNIAYYYLPATDARYKSQSPMVPLLKFIASYYASVGTSILDLGVSSVQGKKQAGLFAFKERMGAQMTYKSTYQLQL